MRGRNCSKKQGMEVDKNLDKLKEEEEQEEQPHLSGAYIRSLVKQLTSSRTKVTHGDGDEDGGGLLSGNRHRHQHQNVTKNGKQEQNQPPAHHHHHQQEEQETLPPPPQQQHKKQVRRRLHTSRPYQERLLNMAEARREIVTALKFHRASMKQANTENPQSQTLQPPPPAPPLAQSPLEHVKLKSRRNPRIYASTTANAAPNFPNYRDNLSYSSLYSPSPNPPPYWVVPPVAPPPPILENFNLNLPNQTLGLNLNFQDFSNLDTTLYHNSYFSPSPISVNQEIPSYVEMSPEEEGEPHLVDSGTGSSFMNIEGGGGDQSGLHQAMGDEEMAEIRSLGEQHQMEWNDKMNLVTSAWWFKFLKNVEIGPEENGEVDDGLHPLIDQVMEFPDWINNANESCLQQQLDDHCSDDYLQDPALPCMDIGEIEGMYEEWLA